LIAATLGPNMGKLPDGVVDDLPAILKRWHPPWVIALVISAILARRSPEIIRAFGNIRNERLKILLKDQRRNQKIRNALSDRRERSKRKGKG